MPPEGMLLTGPRGEWSMARAEVGPGLFLWAQVDTRAEAAQLRGTSVPACRKLEAGDLVKYFIGAQQDRLAGAAALDAPPVQRSHVHKNKVARSFVLC